jgi:hypothetical protein
VPIKVGRNGKGTRTDHRMLDGLLICVMVGLRQCWEATAKRKPDRGRVKPSSVFLCVGIRSKILRKPVFGLACLYDHISTEITKWKSNALIAKNE